MIDLFVRYGEIVERLVRFKTLEEIMSIELTSLPARAAYRPNRCMAILLLMKRLDRPTSLTSPHGRIACGQHCHLR
jgi:hypothetical protein